VDDLDALFRVTSGKARTRRRKPQNDNPVANFIREQRVLQGMTQEELAERAAVPLVTLRSVEQGKPTVRMDTLNKVLGFFDSQVGVVPRQQKNQDQS
jgi:transcriptional regulator with XRE-family HTH domain